MIQNENIVELLQKINPIKLNYSEFNLNNILKNKYKENKLFIQLEFYQR